MKLHLPLGLRKALYNTFIAIFVGTASSASAVRIENGVVYSEPGSPFNVPEGYPNSKYHGAVVGDETTNKLFNSYIDDTLTLKDKDGEAPFITIHYNGRMFVRDEGKLDIDGLELTIGTKGIDPYRESHGEASTAMLMFENDTPLTVGLLTTYNGGHVSDVKSFNVKPLGEEVTHSATCDGGMDIRNNGAAGNMQGIDNGYIISDVAGEHLAVTQGAFSLYNDAHDTGDEYDRWNDGDYGALRGLIVGGKDEDGNIVSMATVKALSDISAAESGIQVYEGSTLDMNYQQITATSLSGTATHVSALAVGDAVLTTKRYSSINEYYIKTFAPQAVARVTGNAGMTVTSGAGGSYSLSDISANGELVVRMGDFVLSDASVDGLTMGFSDANELLNDAALSEVSNIVNDAGELEKEEEQWTQPNPADHAAKVKVNHDLTVNGQLAGYSNAELDVSGHVLTLNGSDNNFAGVLNADSLKVNGNSTFSGLLTTGETEIADGNSVTVSGGTGTHQLGSVTGGGLTVTQNAQAEADSVEVDSLDVHEGSSLSSNGDVKSDSGTVAGTLTSETGSATVGNVTGSVTAAGDILVSGTVGGDAELSSDGTVSITGGGSIGQGGSIDAKDLSLGADTTIMGSVSVTGTTTLTDGITLTVDQSNGLKDVHLGANVNGEEATIEVKGNGAVVTGGVVNLYALVLGEGADLQANVLNIEKTNFTNIDVKADDYTLNGGSSLTGGSLEVQDELTVGVGKDEDGNDVYVSTLSGVNPVTVEGATQIEKDAELLLTDGTQAELKGGVTGEDGSALSVKGENTQVNVTGNVSTDEVNVGQGSTLDATGDVIAGSESDKGDIDGTLITDGKAVVGDVTGAVEAGTGIEAGSVAGGSLSTDSGNVVVSGTVTDGALTAENGNISIEGEVSGSTELKADNGSVTLTQGGTITNGLVSTGATGTGNGLTLAGGTGTHQLGEVTGDALTLTKDDAGNAANAEADSVNVGALTVDTDSTLTATTGDVVASTGGTIAGDIVAENGNIDLTGSTLTTGSLTAEKGDITLTEVDASNSTGDISAAGKLTIEDTPEGKDANLSGKVTAEELDVDRSNVTLSNDANNIGPVTVDADSSLTLDHTAGSANSYGSVTNEGKLTAENANIGELTNNSSQASSVTGGTIGSIDNKKGELTISGTQLKPGADIDNSGTLTLDAVTNADGSAAGSLTNNDGGTLKVQGGSDVDFGSASLGGDVTVSGGSTVTTTGGMTISGETTLDSGTLASGPAGTEISGTVSGEGDITSGGKVSVTGTVDIEGKLEASELATTGDSASTSVGGSVNTHTLTVDDGASVAITGDAKSAGESSSLGDVAVSGSGSKLTLENDDFRGDVSVKDGGLLTLDSSVLTGDVEVTDASFTMKDSGVIGNVTFSNESTDAEGKYEVTNTFTITGENTIKGELTVTDGTTTSLNGSLTVLESDAEYGTTTIRDGSTYEIQEGAELHSNVELQSGKLDIKGELDAPELTFDGVKDDSRVVVVNSDGTNVSLGAVNVYADGTITVNGTNGAGTNLTLKTLAGDADDTLTLNGVTSSTVTIAQSNAAFASDIDSDVDELIVSADEALGELGKLTMADGTTLTTNTAEIGISKEIVGAGDLDIKTETATTLKDEVAVVGTITKEGDAALTFQSKPVTAAGLTMNNGSTVVLDGAAADVDNTLLDGEGGTLVVQNGASFADGNTITLNGTTTADALVQVTGSELESGVKLAVTGKGTLQTDKDTTLTGEVSGNGTLDKTGDAALTLADSNSTFGCIIDHKAGALVATADNALGAASATLVTNGGSIVELAGVTVGNAWNIAQDATLNSTGSATEPEAGSSISGAMAGTATLTKEGNRVTLTGSDAEPTAKGGYTVHVAEGELELSNTQRNGTLSAVADSDIYVTNGASSLGDISFKGDGNAPHKAAGENATRVHIAVVGADKLVSATGEPLSAADAANGTRGAQLVVGDWSQDPLSYADSTKLMVGEGITGFDAEIAHDLELRNVNLVEEGGNSYMEVSINHKGADKNGYEQGVSDAITASEGAGGRLGELVLATGHTGSEADARAALNSIGGAGTAATMAAQMGASRDHMRTLRGAIGQPVPHEAWWDGRGCPQWFSPTSMWMMATGSDSELDADTTTGASGYTRRDVGFLVGGDVTLGKTALMGIAAGYSRSNVDSGVHSISGDQYFVDVYARKNIGRFSQSATLGVGVYDWSLERSVHVRTGDLYADFHGRGDAQTKGAAFNASYEAAWNLRFRNRHVFSPFFMVESTLNHMEGFRESGSLGNAGLHVDMEDAWATTLGIGARYSYEFRGFGRSQQMGVLSARAMFIADVGDINGRMTGSFIGSNASFEAESAAHSRTGVLMGVDALLPVSLHWSLFGNANVEIRDSYTNVSVGAGVKCSF